MNPNKKTQAQFIAQAKRKHGDLYDYSATIYTGHHDPISLICKRCGHTFSQRAATHLKGSGCKNHNLHKGDITTPFVNRVIAIHKDRFDLSKFIYTDIMDKGKVKCNICQFEFERIANDLLKAKIGCANCSGVAPLTTESFVKKAIKIHGDKYSYDHVDVYSSTIKVRLICNRCDREFKMRPNNHLNGQGCKVCSAIRSKGEIYIANQLDLLNIEYLADVATEWSKFKRYDFIIEQYKVVLEVHGMQHYKYTGDKFGDLDTIQENDMLKQQLAIKNGYKYVVLRFDYDRKKLLSRDFIYRFVDVFVNT